MVDRRGSAALRVESWFASPGAHAEKVGAVVTVALHVDQKREESMLGASEAAGVLGLDKYNPPIKIWRRHRGLSVFDDAEQSEPAYWGNVLEPVVRGHYAIKSSRLVVVPTALISR